MALIRGERQADYASAALPPVRMYLDDLEELVRYLEKHVGEVVVEVGNDVAEKIPDLLQLGEDRVRNLTLKADASDETHLSVTVQFASSLFSWVNTTSRSPVAHGIVHGVCDIISRHERRVLGFSHKRLQDFPAWVFGLPMLIAILGPFVLTTNQYTIVSVLSWLVLILLILLSFFPRRSLFILRYRKDAPSFWKRKGDDIVVGVVVGIVLALLGFFAGMSVERSRGEKQAPAARSTQSPPASPASR